MYVSFNMLNIKKFFLILAFGLGINILYAEGDINAFTVTGKIFSPRSFPTFGNVTNVSQVTFYRNQDQWKMLDMPIKNLSIGDIPSSPTEYGMIDTTNTYENYHFNFELEENEELPTNLHSLKIYSGTVPPGLNMLWLAFWGGTYLNGKENGAMIESPLPSFFEYERRMKAKTEWKIRDEKARFPMVESYTSYRGTERRVYDDILKRDILVSISKKNQGLPDVNYQVLEWTNILGQDFPLKVEIKESRLVPFKKEEINTTNITWLEVEKIISDIPQNIFEIKVLPKTQVYDKRILVEGNIPTDYDYLSEDGSLKSLDEIKEDPRMSELMIDALIKENTKVPNPWRNVVIVIILTLLTGWVIFRKKDLSK